MWRGSGAWWQPLAAITLTGLAGCGTSSPADGGDAVADAAQDAAIDGLNEGGTDAATEGGGDGGLTCTDTRAPATVAMFAACGTACSAPTDAVLTANGHTAYFTAFAPDGTGAVFTATMGGTPTMVVGGFQSPIGLAISQDDSTLYVLDLVNDTVAPSGATALGASTVYSVAISSSGRTPVAISGSTIVTATAIAMSADGHSLLLASSASDTTNGLYSLSTAGGTPMAVATGAPFVDPAGLSVAADGTVYVNDPRASAGNLGNIVRVSGTTATALSQSLVEAYPSGLALGCDNASILVAGAAPGGSNKLTWVPMTGAATPVTGTGLVNPTGLHRAYATNAYVVADDSAGTGNTGALFLVSP